MSYSLMFENIYSVKDRVDKVWEPNNFRTGKGGAYGTEFQPGRAGLCPWCQFRYDQSLGKWKNQPVKAGSSYIR